MTETRKLKQLQSQLNLALGESEALKIDLANRHREYNTKLQIVNRLREEISKLQRSGNLKVSEHAIIRYFERVKGFDIAEIEKEILSSEVLKLVETLGGNGTYPNNSFSIVLRDFTVVTIK